MLKKILEVFASFALCAGASFAQGAKWIAAADPKSDEPNSWTAFRKDVNLESVPNKLVARISVDSKYWLWINGKLAVFEGGLKRGPTPLDTYCDEVDIAPFLQKGENKIALLLWYFGKSGFNHLGSGKAGLFFEAKGAGVSIESDASWRSKLHPAYGAAVNPPPNRRLSESNIKFDARVDIDGWQSAPMALFGSASAELGKEGCAPWNKLVARPMPLFKIFPVREAKFSRKKGAVYNERMARPAPEGYDTVVATLPYNMQMTPIITLFDPDGGNLVDIQTDHTFGGSDTNLRAEYITKIGEQTYESLGWLNGEQIILYLPKNVKVLSVKYRESGYDTEMSGEFDSDSEYFNLYWKKARRTLYVNMRDTFFDCPDRERSQWWGDAVLLMSEAFYTCDPKAFGIMRKGIRELVSWASPDGSLHAPIPGTCKSELPGQMCASIGQYGLWNYYMNTGDIETLRFAYPAVKKYLSLWKLDADGIAAMPDKRPLWRWGDWGKNVDKRLVFAAWHSIALEGAANMADALGFPDDAAQFRETMSKIKAGFEKFWNGKEYRHPSHKDWTDDRVQALAVIAGIADKSKYDAIFKTIMRNNNASPYMEKYVMQALFKMGKPDFALSRAQLRFDNMTVDKKYSTLWEGWQVGGYGGGSVNHAWSGGALTNIAQFYCGLYPVEPGWKTFKIAPCPSLFGRLSISVPTAAGTVKSAFEISGGVFKMKISVPAGTTAHLYLPEIARNKTVSINGSEDISKFGGERRSSFFKVRLASGISNTRGIRRDFDSGEKSFLVLPAGEYEVVAK